MHGCFSVELMSLSTLNDLWNLAVPILGGARDHRETQPGHYPTFGEFQRFFVSHVAAAVVARVYAHFNELRRRARAFVLHEAR